MKFVLPIALLLISLSDASGFVAPSQSPMVSPTPQPSNNECASVIYDMVDCLSFLTIGSTHLIPTKTCCVGVKSVLEYNPKCLCVAIESSRAMGFVLDNTKVLVMPSTCSLPINPHCEEASAPKTAPSTAESPSVNPSLPGPPTSSPTANPSSLAATPPSRATRAPSPSKSGSGNVLPSKVFLAAVIVSSFAYVLA